MIYLGDVGVLKEYNYLLVIGMLWLPALFMACIIQCIFSYGMLAQVKKFLNIVNMKRGLGLLTSLRYALPNLPVEVMIVLSSCGASVR
jgi:ubiquitin C-terminal hydrolase